MRKLNATLAIASLLIALAPAAAQVPAQARDKQPMAEERLYQERLASLDRETAANTAAENARADANDAERARAAAEAQASLAKINAGLATFIF